MVEIRAMRTWAVLPKLRGSCQYYLRLGPV